MKSIIISIKIFLIAIVFVACGAEEDAKFKSDSFSHIKVVQCDIINNNVYTNIVLGDVLVKDDNNTNIEVIHDSNNNKKVCVLSGAAHLIR